jgi:hypothetical protein
MSCLKDEAPAKKVTRRVFALSKRAGRSARSTASLGRSSSFDSEAPTSDDAGPVSELEAGVVVYGPGYASLAG